MGRKKLPDVTLSQEDRDTAKKLAGSPKMPMMLRSRCKALLLLDASCGGGLSYSNCMRKTGLSRPTIATIKRLMAEGGLKAVITLQRNANSNNSRRKVDAETEAAILSLACSTPPEGYSQWTSKLLAAALFQKTLIILSDETVRRVLKKKGLHPERTRYWCLAP